MTKQSRSISRSRYRVESSVVALPTDSIFDETNALRRDTGADQTERLTRVRRQHHQTPSGSPAVVSPSAPPAVKPSIWSLLFGKGGSL